MIINYICGGGCRPFSENEQIIAYRKREEDTWIQLIDL